MTEILWLIHVLVISSLRKKKWFCNYFSTKTVHENQWSHCATVLSSREADLSPASNSFALAHQETQK